MQPWIGQAPLRRSQLTAALLHNVESALSETFATAPLGSQIVHLPEGAPDDMENMRAAFRGRRGSVLVVEGVAASTAAGMNPNIGQRPDDLSPDLKNSMVVETLGQARDAIALAFGILPGMLNPAATGPVIREGQRHLAQFMLQPLAVLIAQEATEKLGSAITMDVVRPLQAFDAGGRARAFAAMVKALAEAKAAGLDPQAVEDSLSFIDWAD